MSVTREEQVSAAFVEAADTLDADFDVADFLRSLADRCVHLFAVDAAGLVLADPSGLLRVEASAGGNLGAEASEQALLVTLFELDAEGGPSAHVFTTAAAVSGVDLRSADCPWPQFARAATTAGFAEAHALPLRLRDTVIGVLSLLCVQPGNLGAADTALAQALADVTTIGLLSRRDRNQAEVLSAQLQHALTSRLAIEQAKGMLAERLHIRVDQAFELMRGHARSNHRQVAQIAREVAEDSEAVAELLRGRMKNLRAD